MDTLRQLVLGKRGFILEKNALADSGLEILANGLKALTSLNICNNKITDSSSCVFSRGFASLTHLNISIPWYNSEWNRISAVTVKQISLNLRELV